MQRKSGIIFYILLGCFLAGTGIFSVIRHDATALLGGLIWSAVAFLFYFIRGGRYCSEHAPTWESRKTRLRIFTAACIVSIICILPMGLSPTWNGSVPGDREQYEKFADSVLEGHLDLRYDDNSAEELGKLRNPYDPQERLDKGVTLHWDHAYYNGQYYMYFGVVPAFLLFIPFRLITGKPLAAFHATQIFVVLTVFGLFSLFYRLAKNKFRNMPLSSFVFSGVALSLVTVWYAMGTPGLYCTAITGGICLEVWSLYFFIRAVYLENDLKKEGILAFFGSLCGALVFGCRPTIGLANVLVIPMLVFYIRRRKGEKKLPALLLVDALPYVIVACGLMAYNYARFSNPFEFGQAYQITVSDQSVYTNLLARLKELTPKSLVTEVTGFFFGIRGGEIRNIIENGVITKFPVFVLIFLAFGKNTFRKIKREGMLPLLLVMIILPVLTACFQTVYSPFIIPRYQMDVYYIMCIVLFLTLGFRNELLNGEKYRRFHTVIRYLMLITIFCTVLYYLMPNDGNVFAYYEDVYHRIRSILTFGLL